MMRAIVVAESLLDPAKLADLPGEELCRYPLPLNDSTVEIVEIAVPDERALEACHAMAAWLLPERYFAQLNGADLMYVIFPSTVTAVYRGDTVSELRAQRVGELFGIPRTQMRFLEMFEVDHPDVSEA